MKRVVFACIISLFFVACGTRGDRQQESASIRDSLVIDKQLGPVVERVYAGLLPAADGPGIDYKLTLWNQKYSGTGVYELSMTYLEAANGKDTTFVTSGHWITLRGDAEHNDATVYQLSPRDSLNRMNFLYKGNTLTLLNRNMEHPVSGLNYTLKLK